MKYKEEVFKHFLKMNLDEEDTYIVIQRMIVIAQSLQLDPSFIELLKEYLNDWEEWAYREWDWSESNG